MTHHHVNRLAGAAGLAFVVALGSGCATAVTDPPSAVATEAAAEATEPFSDAEILHVMHTLNNGEIRQAQLALQRSGDPAVQQTAQMILRDHAASNQRITQTAQALGLQLEDNALSQGLQTQAGAISTDLMQAPPEQFDCRYLTRQVELHSIALDTVQTELLPDASRPEVAALLQTAAPTLAMHREAGQHGHVHACEGVAMQPDDLD